MMENDNTLLSVSRAVTTIKTAILQSHELRSGEVVLLGLLASNCEKNCQVLRDLANVVFVICVSSMKFGAIMYINDYWLMRMNVEEICQPTAGENDSAV